MELSSSQVDSFEEEGFLMVEGLVHPEEVEHIRADAVKLCRGEYPCEDLNPVAREMPDEEALCRYLCIHQPHRISPFMRKAVAHRGIGRVLVNHYMNAYSLLPWQLAPVDAGRVARADSRDIVMVAGEDPYAWKGTENRGGAHVRRFDPTALEEE